MSQFSLCMHALVLCVINGFSAIFLMQNKRTAAGDRNKRIQVERRRSSVVEKIEGTASQIAKYDNRLNGNRGSLN